MNGIKLNFINRSNDAGHSHIVLFQKNERTDFQDPLLAWKVFDTQTSATESFSGFVQYSISVRDDWGHSARQFVNSGERWEVADGTKGHLFALDDNARGSNLLEIHNAGSTAFTVIVYKNGVALAEKPGVQPGTSAEFDLTRMYAGLTDKIKEGDYLPGIETMEAYIPIYAEGISEADLILSGAGTSIDPFALNFIPKE